MATTGRTGSLDNRVAVYLDNSVIGREGDWPAIRNLFDQARGYRLAFSEWGLYEIASHGDRSTVMRRADFVESLNPVWLIERLHVQCMELRDFVWRNLYRSQPGGVKRVAR